MKKLLSILLSCSLIVSFSQCSNTNNNTETTTEEEVSSTAIADGHVKIWDESQKQVIELIEYMPDKFLDFKPHDSMRTFAEQIVHIALSSELITNMFLKDIPRPKEMPEIDANSMDKEDLKAFVNDKLGNARNVIAQMTDDQLLHENVKSVMGNEMTRLEGMFFATDHLTNHKAKANFYIRLAGHVPPRYRYY